MADRGSWNPALTITVARMALVIPFVVLFHVPGPLGAWGSAGIFMVAGLSDALDGWLARRLDCVTSLGAALDPIADKVMVCTALVLLAGDGRASAIAAVILLVREFVIAGLREAFPGSLPVRPLGKAKTMVQFVALATLLLLPVFPGKSGVALTGSLLLWLAATLAVVSGLDYGVRGWRSRGTGVRGQ